MSGPALRGRASRPTGKNGDVHLVVTAAVLVAVVIATSAVCRRFDLSAPLVLVALGMAASFVPWIPDVELTAELALVGFLPPLLYSAALQTSLVDFNANRRPILLLSVGLVAFTTVVVGAVVHAVVPSGRWSHRPTPSRRRRSRAGSGCRVAS